MKRVVIVGAGFGGISAAKKLASHSDVEITVIDKRNHHLFQPLLYQVATAGLSPAEIAFPIRSVFTDDRNVNVLMDEVISVDLPAKKVVTKNNSYPFDYLILACGSTHSYFGHNEWEEHAPGLKTLEQATELRRRILNAFELAERETDIDKVKMHQTFVVIGGGPTGVEMAGSIAEISRSTLKSDFRKINPSNTRVILIEAGPRILPSFSQSLSQVATKSLEQMGVQVWVNTKVTDVRKECVQLGEELIKASTVVWAAGVKASKLNKTLGLEMDRAGRVVVQKDLTVKDHPYMYVIGDQANFILETGTALPGLAPVAKQEGEMAAANIIRSINSKPLLDFHYFDKGQMATIGRKRAIVQVRGVEFSGFIAWVAWLFIHILYLIGFKNRFMVFYQWAWSYLTYRRGARLIVSKDWREPDNNI